VPVTDERCGRDYEHAVHEWCEGIDETHSCDGLADVVDDRVAQMHQGSLAEVGM
jgi:hypothetical protein